MQTVVIREKQMNVTFTEEELERLKQLAAHYSVSPQSVIRMLIKQAYDASLGPTTAPPRKPRGKR